MFLHLYLLWSNKTNIYVVNKWITYMLWINNRTKAFEKHHALVSPHTAFISTETGFQVDQMCFGKGISGATHRLYCRMWVQFSELFRAAKTVFSHSRQSDFAEECPVFIFITAVPDPLLNIYSTVVVVYALYSFLRTVSSTLSPEVIGNGRWRILSWMMSRCRNVWPCCILISWYHWI